MEHIRQHDWYATERDEDFLNEHELDNCVMERIIRNRFFDPLLSDSDTEPEDEIKIDWSQVFRKMTNNTKNDQSNFVHASDSPISMSIQPNRFRRNYVPCLKPMPPYPKVSTLTIHQHKQLLKVICSQNAHVLPSEFMLRPTKTDHKQFEVLQPVYKSEQQEYIEWAKSLWTSSHCVRALKPKQTIETVYEAEYKMKAQELNSYAKSFQLAAQIPYDGKDQSCEFTHAKDLITVSVSELPQIEYPSLDDKFYIMKSCSVPEPCKKHPCRFILPNDKTVTMLPLTEIHRELAQYASEYEAQYIVSENALRCLVEVDRKWNFPLSVCEVIDPDGEKSNIVVMGSDFSMQKETSQIRSYKAYRHLLEFALTPPPEKAKTVPTLKELSSNHRKDQETIELSSDDEDDALLIDIADIGIKMEQRSDDETSYIEVSSKIDKDNATTNVNSEINDGLYDLGIFSCTCEGSLFEKPPPRSFRLWKLRNKNTNESFNVIVHCSHKAKTKFGEVILEPIPEYQLDLGGSQMSPHKVKSLALSLALRKTASLLTARVEAATGEVVRYDIDTRDEWKELHGDPMADISANIHAAFSQLQGLLPGNYILRHEPSHGLNAMLYVSRPNANELLLQFNNEQLEPDEEAKAVKTPPTIEPVLLPYHKSRHILPCAFTPYEVQVVKEYRKPLSKQKAPSPAIKWPKKKKRKNKKN